MLEHAIGGIPDGIVEGFAAIAVILLLTILAGRASSRQPSGGAALKVTGPDTGRSVLRGIPPQEFAGRIAEELRELLDLPARNESTVATVMPDFEDLRSASAAQARFSTLSVTRSGPGERGGEPDGIQLALRADCIRPGRFHTSQAVWDEGRRAYLLDEWMEHDGRVFNSGPLWVDITGDDIARERREVTETLQPETWLDQVSRTMRAASATAMREGTGQYIVLSMVPNEGEEADVAATLWFEAGDLRLRKVELVATEDGRELGAYIAVFAGYGTEATIAPPEWLNGDSVQGGDFVVTSDEICAVEHW